MTSPFILEGIASSKSFPRGCRLMFYSFRRYNAHNLAQRRRSSVLSGSLVPNVVLCGAGWRQG
jgi:hypothetical protein